MSTIQTFALLGSLAASVSAHGYVSGIVADGTYYTGYSPSFQYQNPPPTVAGWSDPENLSNGYVAPSAFSDPDIICHLSATPGGTSIKVAAGAKLELQWTTWPESHHGPVLDYLAKCSGDCSEVDKTSLSFFKIAEGGLIDGSTAPGKWASDELIANNNTGVVTIPTSIAAGNYVLRHEIIALHSAGQSDGAQNYPQCINLEITSDGTDEPEGTLGTALYKQDDAGILINIYNGLDSYEIPGPALYSGAASGGETDGSGSATTAVSASSAPTATAISTSTPYSNSSAYVQTTTPVSTSSYAEETYAPSTTAKADATVTSAPIPKEYKPTAAPTFFSDVVESSTTTAAAAPTATGSYGSGSGTDDGSDDTSESDEKPSSELPEGWTLKDLQQWVSYLLKQGWSSARIHQRDFKV